MWFTEEATAAWAAEPRATRGGTYDQDAVYAAIAERHPDAAVIVPPRTTAVPSGTVEPVPTLRDRHLQCITETGRMAWQQASGYNKRAKVEAAIWRWRQVIGNAYALVWTNVGRPRST